MISYVLSADAAADLDDIWEYIAADSIDAADNWIEQLFDAFETLGMNPRMGHVREDLTAFPSFSGLLAPTSSFTAQSDCRSRLPL